MTHQLAGPRRWTLQQRVIVALIIAAIILVSGLILLGLTGDFLVDWLWFSAVGYLPIYWTTIGAKATVFAIAFTATGAILWQFGAGSSVNAGPAVVDGTVYWGSGYARAGVEGSGNNQLFAFSIDGR